MQRLTGWGCTRHILNFDPEPRRRTLQQDVSAKSINPSWSASGSCGRLSGRLDEARILHKPPKILFMQVASENGFHDPLQIEESESLGHEFEDDGPVFKLPAKPTHRRRQNAAVVEHHLSSQGRQGRPALRRDLSILRSLGD